jgi:hypothetical protein
MSVECTNDRSQEVIFVEMKWREGINSHLCKRFIRYAIADLRNATFSCPRWKWYLIYFPTYCFPRTSLGVSVRGVLMRSCPTAWRLFFRISSSESSVSPDALIYLNWPVQSKWEDSMSSLKKQLFFIISHTFFLYSFKIVFRDFGFPGITLLENMHWGFSPNYQQC